MKKFSFRLQPVLELKEKALEDKRLEMAKVIKKLSDTQGELEALEQQFIDYNEEMIGYSANTVINPMELSGLSSYMFKLETDKQNKLAQIEEIKKALRIKQLEVNEALKNVKVLEKLKETQTKKFYQMVDKKEADEIDDIVTSRYKVKAV